MLITKSNILDIISNTLGCMYLSDIKSERYQKSALSVLNTIDADNESKQYALNYIGKEVTC